MQNSFKHHINTKLSFLKDRKLIIAISGGIDSVVLTQLCYNMRLNIALAHCNFNLRGEESDGDEAFLLGLAENLDLEIFIESFDTVEYATENKLSIQMAARELRYRWFEELTDLLHFDYILTAHHADDNLETFLINLSRGTGLDGLTGIPEINRHIVRPLMPFSRQDIHGYAKSYQLAWREDSSNSSTKYLRNKLRHDVVPVLKDINPKWLQNFNTTQSHLQDSKILIDDYMVHVYKDVVSHKKDHKTINVQKLLKYPNPRPYLYELLKAYNFTAWEDIYNLLHAQSGKQVFSETHRLIKDRDVLILTENPVENAAEVQQYLIDTSTDTLTTEIGHFKVETVSEVGEKHPKSEVFLNKEKLQFPLVIRPWEAGDFFFPFGMKGSKKLSKYFKDEKLSLLEKEQVWVICSGEEVVWVVNRRSDDRFKITANTSKILKISFTAN